MNRLERAAYSFSPNTDPPSIIYIPPEEPERRELWDRIARFSWLARWAFEGEGGWGLDVRHPSYVADPDRDATSGGFCSVSNTLMAYEVGKRFDTKLVIRAGRMVLYGEFYDELDDHVWAEEPPGEHTIYANPRTMTIDVTGDQFTKADVIVGPHAPLSFRQNINYDPYINGYESFDPKDFAANRGASAGLETRMELLRSCLASIGEDSGAEYWSLFQACCI